MIQITNAPGLVAIKKVDRTKKAKKGLNVKPRLVLAMGAFHAVAMPSIAKFYASKRNNSASRKR
ncbi:hypothetical protein PSJM300_14850 [Stutzerimonas stutzeri DSM 10701]|nr:hypothetical protein PSJM300_14850 [Stutzerimonas stutzeri DSM 10701]